MLVANTLSNLLLFAGSYSTAGMPLLPSHVVKAHWLSAKASEAQIW